MQLSQPQKKLLSLLADGEFHSGTELAALVEMSRSDVWKQLKVLADLGLGFNAISGKGYRLEKALTLLDSELILNSLNHEARSLITSFNVFDQIDSTNTYLVKRASEHALSGSVCLAEQQISGRGRRGRSWISPYGHNIYLSVLWRFQTSPAAIAGLSLAAGVAVIRALKNLYPHPFQLKWPNDIYYRQKKLGGILVEVSGESDGPCHAVIGVGLNTYVPAAEASTIDQDWTDLSQITGEFACDRNILAGALLNQLITITAEYEEKGITGYLDEWRVYDCLKDKPAVLYAGQHRYDGIVKGVDEHGLLLLTRPDGTLKAFASGEISFNKR